MAQYLFRHIEKKWQKHWDTHKSYEVSNQSTKPFYYVLEMLPYPSGKLHMGHVRNYAIGDAIARYKIAKGFHVLHPMGWDSFGLPAENAAIENKCHPKDWTDRNISNMKDQMKMLGLAYDWSREFSTCDVSYYGLEQKIFLDFYKKGLIYRKESWVNWDPIDQCVLANEQVIDGKGWRSGAVVEQKKMSQWFVNITHYAQELLDDLEKLSGGWPENVCKMQERWIGRSQGAVVYFDVEDAPNGHNRLEIFTTMPETLYGASFVGISPLHPLADALAVSNPEIQAFIKKCQETPTKEEVIATQEKQGIATGLFATHPLDPSWKLPIYIANFILMDYGTGAIFACPAHDERDHEFALKYNLPIKPLVDAQEHDFSQSALVDGVKQSDQKLINSKDWNGLTFKEAHEKAIDHLVAIGKGEKKITFRLRDWCVSRQRYWGCPIPVIYCDDCGIVPAQDLPVTLPYDVTFDKPGNPLDHHPTWKNTNCPNCRKPAHRETDTLDTFFESCWYLFRYCCPNSDQPLDATLCEPWLPVEWYIGGIEHAVLHLLYVRFFTKALRDCGYFSIDYPVKNLLTQGMVCHPTYKHQNGQWLYPNEIEKNDQGNYICSKDGTPVTVGRSEKMSKSKKNLVDPMEILETYGADVARLFILSDTPPNRNYDWNEDGLEGCWRYLNRLWRICMSVNDKDETQTSVSKEAEEAFLKGVHRYLKQIDETYDQHLFNKTIAFIRELTRHIEEAMDSISRSVLLEGIQILLRSLEPISPHVCFELWENIFNGENILNKPWIEANAAYASVEEVTIAVQVNGKLKGTFLSKKDENKVILEEKALNLTNSSRNSVKRIIIVPNRLVNIVL